jgi:hypothetical protein
MCLRRRPRQSGPRDRDVLRRAAEVLRAAALFAAVLAAPDQSGGARLFLELTAPQATSVRAVKGSDACHPSVCVDGGGAQDRWLVTNPYLPGDRSFFSMTYGAASVLSGVVDP